MMEDTDRLKFLPKTLLDYFFQTVKHSQVKMAFQNKTAGLFVSNCRRILTVTG